MALPSSVFIQHKPQNCHHNIKQHWTVLGNYLNKNIGKHPSSYRHSQHLYHSPQHSLLSQCHTPQTLLTCSPLSSKTFVSHRCCPSLVTGEADPAAPPGRQAGCSLQPQHGDLLLPQPQQELLSISLALSKAGVRAHSSSYGSTVYLGSETVQAWL